jgi:hypothetical protein
MSGHAQIKAALQAHAGLAALVGTRIRADIGEADDAYPFVVFKRSALLQHRGLDGSLHLTQETFEVECWAHSRSTSVDVSEQVMDAMAIAGMTVDVAQADGIDPGMRELVTVLEVEVDTIP